eukprot:TRINITY_DN3511_c0_g1_i1.p1 TRINITY_DN3511_c0_g1~~TRINITY_DN3511_c0_g1_i1.p1  ORF type:complete len:400 (-),score=95.70 TRINITY_DN3511_c0_g1_i1:119-1171(-)
MVSKAREESPEARAMDKMMMWGVDMEAGGEAVDIVLLKYLRAEELDLEKAANRVTQTLVFRADCKINELCEAEMPACFQGHDFISGVDSEGRPVMISRFGSMNIEEVFGNTEAFVRYRAKLMEQAIGLLKFEKGAAENLLQVHDYSGVLGSMYKADVKNGVTAVSKVFAEHYPEFKGKTMFMNFPAVFSGPFKAFAALLPERTREKFVILGKDDQLALFEHIGPELLPESLGGLYRESETGLKCPGQVAWLKARADLTLTMVEVDKAAKVLWEVRVCYAEASYEVVFVDADGGKEQVISSRGAPNYLQADEGVICGEWDAPSPGKVECRFKNEYAWFKSRVCVCRAAIAP